MEKDFVDNFLTPLYLLKDEKVEVEHHDVPTVTQLKSLD